eukprot:1194508-Prorocentrum_minimum.AAC.3
MEGCGALIATPSTPPASNTPLPLPPSRLPKLSSSFGKNGLVPGPDHGDLSAPGGGPGSGGGPRPGLRLQRGGTGGSRRLRRHGWRRRRLVVAAVAVVAAGFVVAGVVVAGSASGHGRLAEGGVDASRVLAAAEQRLVRAAYLVGAPYEGEVGGEVGHSQRLRVDGAAANARVGGGPRLAVGGGGAA